MQKHINMCKNASTIPKIQFAIEPFAPKTTQNTPSIAEAAATQFCQENWPFITNDITDNAQIDASNTISNTLSVFKLPVIVFAHRSADAVIPLITIFSFLIISFISSKLILTIYIAKKIIIFIWK